jgi:uncharacterized phosphatase
MKIALVRHGETDWNKEGRLQGREDIPLNDAGIGQAAEAAEYLAKSSWDAIITSPLARAKQTAGIIAEKTGIARIHEEAGFIEREMGEVSGLTMEERKAAFPDGTFGGMEPLEQLQARVSKAVLTYAEHYAGSDIIVVSHGAAISAFLAYISHGEIGTGRFMLKNGCINLVEYDDDTFRVVFYNKAAGEL